MKGQKTKEKEKYIDKAKTVNHLKGNERNTIVGFTYLDLVPIDFTRENVMNWIANTGWIEGLIIKYLGDSFVYLDDYIQEIYLSIFDKLDRLIEVYENKGILSFCGYIKAIVKTSCYAEGAQVYKKIRYFSDKFTVSLEQEQWNDIIDTYNPETDKYYKFNKTNDLI